MSLWIVDGGIGLTLPVVARVDDWQENDHIDVTGADENGEWLPEPVRYVMERGTCKPVTYGCGRMTDTEKSALERGIDELRKQLEYDRQTSRSRLARIDQLKAENAKLRELVRGLGHCAQGGWCEDCLLYDLSELHHCCEERLSRELGIEVTE